MEFARSINSGENNDPTASKRYLRNRPVTAVLVHKNQKPLAFAQNHRLTNRTFHSELILAQGYFALTGLPFPRGSQIYSTLKPCRMCAAMIWQMSEFRNEILVIYDEFDQGPMAKETILNANSFDRKSAIQFLSSHLKNQVAMNLTVNSELERPYSTCTTSCGI